VSDIAALVADNLDIWTGAIERKSGAGRGGGKRISLYGIERLQGLILDLAVRGKLVPQDPADESAGELLKRIPADWAASRRRNRSNAKQANEIGSAIVPVGWIAIPGNTIFRTRSGNSKLIKGKLHAEDGPERYKGYSASGQDVWLDSWEHEGAAIILSAVGARCGKAFLARGKWSAVANTHIIWLKEDVTDAEFAMLVLNNEDFWERAGGAQPFVKVGNTLDRDFLLPPLAEQRRIVAKVDELMGLCAALERESTDALATHQTLVETLLATLVNSADAADLTANWARVESHFDTLFTTEVSIDALKQTILDLAVRGMLVEQDAANWPVEPLGKYVKDAAAGWSPKCIETPRTGDNWGVLKVSAVTWGRFQPEENKELPSSLEPRPEIEVAPGDFLISRANTADLVARSVVVPLDAPKKLMMSDKIIRFRFNDKIDPEYVNLVHASPVARAYYARVAGGTSSSMKNVSQAQIRALEIPIPPLAEQQSVVAKVDKLMAICDALKARLADAADTRRNLADAIVERAAS